MNDMMTQEEAMNMSNEQAVQILIPMRNMMCDQNGCPISDAMFALDKAIEALSAARPQGEWIPCSERLPDENVVVLTQAKFKDDIKMAVSARQDYNYWTGWGTREINIVAWMPLPMPWKGADNE